jgi:acyl-CoA dehydrogenase
MERGHFEGEHEIFRESFRRFVLREIAPNSERWREQGQVDREAFEQAGSKGYLLMWADERYGGAAIADFRYEQVLIEENLRHGDPGFYMTLHSRIVAPYINALASEEIKARLLPGCVLGKTILGIAMTEPGAGSDLAGIRTRAEDRGDHWTLSGSKTYISNGQLGDHRSKPSSRHRPLSCGCEERGLSARPQPQENGLEVAGHLGTILR